MWYLMCRRYFSWYTGQCFWSIDVLPVFDQKTREMAVKAGRRLWANIKKRPPEGTVTGENWKLVDPEVVWREPLERIKSFQNRKAGGVAQEVRQPDETAEHEYQISG